MRATALSCLMLLLAACNSSESKGTTESDSGTQLDADNGSGSGDIAEADSGSGEDDATDTEPADVTDSGAASCDLSAPPEAGQACDCEGTTLDFLSTPTGPVRCTCLNTGWGCASVEPDPDTTVDDTTDTTVDDTTDTTVDDTTDTTVDDTTDTAPPAGPCEAGGGVCIGFGGACETVGGTRLPSGDSQCLFSDGPGACCVPPPVQPTGDTCADRGGVCAPIAGCNFTNSAFAPTPTPSCGFGGFICCVPNTVCGEETMVCCNDTTTFRPACDRGQWICTIDGTTMRPPSECP